MKRREFIALVGGGVATWSISAYAQQPERMRRIGILMAIASDDSQSKPRMTAFLQSLQKLGWTDGHDLQIIYRWSDVDQIRKTATELVTLTPDVILTSTSVATAALLEATRTIPIVFTVVADPVGAGYVDSLAHPGGNVTGFANYDYPLASKWLELLKQIAPNVTQVAVLRDPSVAAGPGQLAAIQLMATSLGVELRPVNVRNASEIEHAITSFAAVSNGGLIVTGSPQAFNNRTLIIRLAARYQLPAIYNISPFVTDGGLLSYGSDNIEAFRRAAVYVDRILKGEKPADLPVQMPTKYELSINLKTAKALGLTVPASLLTSADLVIE
jgi:putative ABC transport system substrate-binding protein